MKVATQFNIGMLQHEKTNGEQFRVTSKGCLIIYQAWGAT